MTTVRLKALLFVTATSFVGLMAACTSESAAGNSDSEVVGGFDCNISAVLCEITPPQCGAGQTATRRGDCYGPCAPIGQCKAGTFNCHRGGPATCEIVPPRCAANETLTTVDDCFGPCVPSTVCQGSAPPSAGTANCDIATVQCEIPTPRCPEGKTPSVAADGFCYGACVDIAQCKARSFACDQGGPATCEIVQPTCPAGQRLTTTDGCFGPCVPASVCK